MTIPRLASKRHRIFLVEDHPAMREGFAQLLNAEPDLQVCGQAGTAAEALQGLPAARPDLAIVDLSLQGSDGMDLIKDLASRHTALPVLVLSTHDETLYAERSLRAGAKGYVAKHAPTEQVMAAIHKVLRGNIYLSEEMSNRMLGTATNGGGTPPASEVERLSDRELEVFGLIGRGRSTAQISSSLHVSGSTVATHRAHIMEKLKLENSRELIRRAVAWVLSRDL
jgi:DNA-binding NarL/FixJ family response regulator